VYAPAGVVAAVEIFRLEVKAGVPEAGVKVAVVPSGRPEAERVTAWAKPCNGVTETWAATDPACCAEPEVGSTDTAKSGMGAAVTVSV